MFVLAGRKTLHQYVELRGACIIYTVPSLLSVGGHIYYNDRSFMVTCWTILVHNE